MFFVRWTAVQAGTVARTVFGGSWHRCLPVVTRDTTPGPSNLNQKSILEIFDNFGR